MKILHRTAPGSQVFLAHDLTSKANNFTNNFLLASEVQQEQFYLIKCTKCRQGIF